MDKNKKPLSVKNWCVMLCVLMTILLFLAHRFLNDTSFLYQLVFAGTSGVIASAIVTFFADRANANNRKYLKFVYLRGLHILVEGIVSQNEYIYANGWDKFFEKNKYNIERWLEVVDQQLDPKKDPQRVLYFLCPAILVSERYNEIRNILSEVYQQHRTFLEAEEVDIIIRMQQLFVEIDKIIEEYTDITREVYLTPYTTPKRQEFERFVNATRNKESIDISSFIQPLLAYKINLLTSHEVQDIIELITCLMKDLYQLREIFISEGFLGFENITEWDKE